MNIVITLKLVALLCLSVLLSQNTDAQTFRAIDGTGNNLNNPSWGGLHHQLPTITELDFADGIGAPAAPNRANPRTISNLMFDQTDQINDPLKLSDFVWVFGQFIDHDITLVGENHQEPAFIPVPAGDDWFDPFNTGQALIFMTRSAVMEGTGTSTSNPRAFVNEITAFIDGSGVYGSDAARSNWLRSGFSGKLKTSSGNLLPFNTDNNEFSGTVDPNAPEMANPVGLTEKLFVVGDVRGNENPLLLAFHTLFVREHNRICDEILVNAPGLSDEEVFQRARKKVGALLQNIVFNEWLPAMGITLPEYTGYDPGMNPGITNVFSGAAFRLGHTLLNSNIIRLNNDGTPIAQGNLTLKEAFFNPLEVMVAGGIDPLFKGMATQIEQDLDCKVIDDVRNFLFGPPGAGGLDLAAININRGRERGITDFNTIRGNLGLPEYDFFEEITPDQGAAWLLQNIYEFDIDNIDAWVGMLAEEHMPGALLGETVMKIMEQQFTALRDGDRFFYKNDPFYSAAEVAEIESTTLHDVIMRNTEITLMQENVFEAMPHDSIASCGATGPIAAINGFIHTENGLNIGQVNVDLGSTSTNQELLTTDDGAFAFPNLSTCDGYTITPSKNVYPTNGVTTIDLVFIQRHILNITLLNSPYKILAADADGSGSVTTLDLVHFRKLILNTITELPNGTPSWRFIPATHIFMNPANPFEDMYDGFISINQLTMPSQRNFIGIKIGDVNGNAIPASINNAEDREEDMAMFYFNTMDQMFEPGEVVNVEFKADLNDIMAYQFTLDYDHKALEYVSMDMSDKADLNAENFAVLASESAITASWDGDTDIGKDEMVFSISFRAKASGQLSSLVRINSILTPAYAYKEGETKLIRLNFNGNDMMLYQNYPNPFIENTTVSFILPGDAPATLTMYNMAGQLIREIQGDYTRGYNEVALKAGDFPASGIFYYELSSEFGTQTRKMVIISPEIR